MAWKVRTWNPNYIDPGDPYALGQWEVAADLPSPNREFDQGEVSTMAEYTLHDGSPAFITPANKSIRQPISLVWTWQTTLKARLEGYVRNNTGIQLKTTTGEYIEGSFIRTKPRWRLSGEKQRYMIEAVFQPRDIDGDNYIGSDPYSQW